MSTKIITDSASDLIEKIRDDFDIDIMPIVVTQGSNSYLDGVNINNDKLYKDMRSGVVYKTAALSPIDYERKFKEVLDTYDRAIYIALSSGLSSTYQNALLAKKSLCLDDDKLIIIDSRGASMGEGMLVYFIAKHINDEMSAEEICAYAQKLRDMTEYVFYVDTLEYLKRGGRVSKLQAAIGGLINLKVILTIKNDGKIYPEEKIRGEVKAMKKAIKNFKDRLGTDIYEDTIFISHADVLSRAEDTFKLMQEAFPGKKVFISEISATIGAHSGPGTIAFFAIKNFA